MLVVVINLKISLEIENLVTRNSGKPGRKRLMKMILYGQGVKTKVTMKIMKRIILKKEIRKVKQQAREHSDLIDANDSDELRSVGSRIDDEKSLWTGSEDDDEEDIATEAYPNESSDKPIDKLFEFEETSKYWTISKLLKPEQEPEELSPGKQARKIAVENALKKLKGQTYVILTLEYAELRQRGPKKPNMQFFQGYTNTYERSKL
ncbi:hypothetical protein FF1_047035 [Malus domestica]